MAAQLPPATPAQKDQFIRDFVTTRAFVPPVLALKSKYDISEIEKALRDLEAAIPQWRAGTMNDRQFNDALITFAGSLGSVFDASGNDVMASQTPAGDALRKLSDAIPQVKVGKITGTGSEIQVTGKKGVSVGLVLGLAALVAVGLVLANRKRE